MKKKLLIARFFRVVPKTKNRELATAIAQVFQNSFKEKNEYNHAVKQCVDLRDTASQLSEFLDTTTLKLTPEQRRWIYRKMLRVADGLQDYETIYQWLPDGMQRSLRYRIQETVLEKYPYYVDTYKSIIDLSRLDTELDRLGQTYFDQDLRIDKLSKMLSKVRNKWLHQITNFNQAEQFVKHLEDCYILDSDIKTRAQNLKNRLGKDMLRKYLTEFTAKVEAATTAEELHALIDEIGEAKPGGPEERLAIRKMAELQPEPIDE